MALRRLKKDAEKESAETILEMLEMAAAASWRSVMPSYLKKSGVGGQRGSSTVTAQSTPDRKAALRAVGRRFVNDGRGA
jgi:hypothetical protein